MGLDRRATRERSVLAGLRGFCGDQGLGSALAGEVIEAYLCQGLDGRAPSTKGTYYSVLRRLANVTQLKGAPHFSGSLASAPYDARERAQLYAVAASQRRPWRRYSATMLLALGIGAGLRARSATASSWTTRRPSSPARPTVTARSWWRAASTARPCPRTWWRPASSGDARIAARAAWRLPRKAAPDHDGYERFSCPALEGHVCCSLRPGSAARAVGAVPVLNPPPRPDKICTQSSITIPPDVGARFRQDLAFGSPQWARVYATYRNTIEGTNGYLKDPAHESLQSPGRRRVRGIAAQSVFVALLLMAANFRKIAAYRNLVENGRSDEVVERARRRRRVSITDFLPPASTNP